MARLRDYTDLFEDAGLGEIPLRDWSVDAEIVEAEGEDLSDNRGYPSMPSDKGGLWTVYYQVPVTGMSFMEFDEDDLASDLADQFNKKADFGYPYVADDARIAEVNANAGWIYITLEMRVVAYWD